MQKGFQAEGCRGDQNSERNLLYHVPIAQRLDFR
jgi:hypothetical protein